MKLNKNIQKTLEKVETNYHYFLALIICMYLYKAIRYMRSPFYSPDAENYYLPFARDLISKGPALLFEKNSLILSPGTYIWPALFGGNATIIRPANLILGVFMVLLIFDIGRLLYSKLTGLLSGFLFAISPIIIVWIPSLLSEPPFIFFSLLFIWSLIKVALDSNKFILICAFALSASIFIRPVWIYPSCILFLISPILYFLFKEVRARAVFKKILLTIALGLALPIAFIIHNQIKYQLPAIAVGSGNALFLGTNIFTGGFEPPIVNLSYVVGKISLPEFATHDFIEHDKKLVSVSKETLKQMPLKSLIYWVFSKFSWFSFFSPLDASLKTSIIRMIEFSLSLVGFIWAIREKRYLIIALGFAYILQTGQAIPALYNSRYSAGNLEPILILLAPIGLIALYTSLQQSLRLFAGFSILWTMIFTSAVYAHFTFVPKIIFPKEMNYKILYENSTEKSDHLKTWSMYLPKIVPQFPSNTFIRVELAKNYQEFKKCGPVDFIIGNNQIVYSTDLSTAQSENDSHIIFLGAITSSEVLIPAEDTTLSIRSRNCITTDEIKKISYVEASLEKYWLPKK